MLAFFDTLMAFAVVMLGVSLVITVLNQAASALLAHRGSNLKWGLETLFHNIAGGQGLSAYSHWLAETVVTHPLVSDSLFSTALKKRPGGLLGLVRRWQFASALKPDELRGVLQNIAAYGPPQPQVAPLPTQLPTLANDINALLAPNSGLDDWFTRINDRITQRFTVWMRLWTVAFALVFSVVGCLDSIALIKALYSQGDARAQLVGAAPQLSAIAGTIIPTGAKTPEQAATQSVTDMYTKALNDAVTAAGVAGTPASNIANTAAVDTWLNTNLSDATKRPAIKTQFDKNLAAAITVRSKEAAQVFSLFGNITIAGVGWGNWKFSHFPHFVFWKQLAGVLASWLLLCLGAPFWFNTLSSLASLRPVLAKK
jgi:hypothetical protein